MDQRIKQLIGREESTASQEFFLSRLSNNEEVKIHKASGDEIDKAALKAADAFKILRRKTGQEKALFLEAIANEIHNLGDSLIEICSRETGLPRARLEGERDRTVNQLKLFATLLREGSWVNARIDTALPDRKPLPRTDIRSMQIALGPVVVFGASNFPLAFSVAGGDTASALAAGCPVIVKAHEAHPQTSYLVGKAIVKASTSVDFPDGTFSLLFGDGPETGSALVKHPIVKAVGFTGSFRAGKALFDLAAQRPESIPVYAEMGSTNPVFILPRIMKEKGEEIAKSFSASVTLGVGQFCTCPGLLFHSRSDSTQFVDDLRLSFSNTAGGAMLTEKIRSGYEHNIANHTKIPGVVVLASGSQSEDNNFARPALLATDGLTFQKEPQLSAETFGPSSVVVALNSKEDFLTVAKKLHGHLTATVHGTGEDLMEYRELLEILEVTVGRLIINGYPTGVEVSHAMVHGGPFPATTDARSTSVGTTAIYRFTRPVCYQNFPDTLLPEELKESNPLKIWRLKDGEMMRH